MAQLLDIFAFLSVLLRGLTLAFESLAIGGAVFLVVVGRAPSGSLVDTRLVRLLTGCSLMLCVTQICYIAANSAILTASANLAWTDVAGANFLKAGAALVVGAVIVATCARIPSLRAGWPVGCALMLMGSVMTSHSVARLENRWILAALTSFHQLATATWIGGLPYLIVALRSAPKTSVSAEITARFSKLAIASVTVLFTAGLGMGLVYVGSLGALTGTAYGAMLVSKVILACVILALGALNLRIVQTVKSGAGASLLPLRRFAEAEVGIGFTIILAAASLTSSPPAVDVQSDRVAPPEIAARLKPVIPRLTTPALSELSPATPLAGSEQIRPESFVPGQTVSQNNAADIAWSEYNHHWAGLVVLFIGLLSVSARWFAWARNWPLAFFGLAAFLFVRADAENWPLGPRGFWESFQVAEVAQHRVFVLLIVLFAIFEWAVQTGRISSTFPRLVFPSVCALGGALLITHSHSLVNVKEEFLAELSHLPLAVLAVLAGWSRWLEIRLPDQSVRVVRWIWPVCFVLIGAILLNYREA